MCRVQVDRRAHAFHFNARLDQRGYNSWLQTHQHRLCSHYLSHCDDVTEGREFCGIQYVQTRDVQNQATQSRFVAAAKQTLPKTDENVLVEVDLDRGNHNIVANLDSDPRCVVVCGDRLLAQMTGAWGFIPNHAGLVAYKR